jgi:hypothetical protein
MRTGRAIIISALLALGLAGPVMAASTAVVATGSVPVAQAAASPSFLYHA